MNSIIPEPPSPRPSSPVPSSDDFAVTRLPSPYDQKTPPIDQMKLNETGTNDNYTINKIPPSSSLNPPSNLEAVPQISENPDSRLKLSANLPRNSIGGGVFRWIT